MKIKTKLLILALLPIIISFALGIYNFNVSQKVNALNLKAQKADHLVLMVSELTILTYEFGNLQIQRPLLQLEQGIRQLKDELVLFGAELHTPQEEELIEKILRRLDRVEHQISELVLIKSQNVGQNNRETNQFVSTLISRLNLELQATMNLMDRLQKLQYSSSAEYLKINSNVNILALISLSAILTIVGVVISRNVLNSLTGLREGLKTISQGDFDKDIPVTTRDELGDMALTFNNMAHSLKSAKKDVVSHLKARSAMEYELRRRALLDEYIVEISKRILNDKNITPRAFSADITRAAIDVTESAFGMAAVNDGENGFAVTALLRATPGGVVEAAGEIPGDFWRYIEKKLADESCSYDNDLKEPIVFTFDHDVEKIERIILWPAYGGSKVLGFIAVANAPSDYKPSLCNELDRLANFFAIAVERAKTESELATSYQNLEQRVDQRTGELTRLNELLKSEVEERILAEERYRILFERAPFGVLIVDPETLATVDFNNLAHRQLGYTSEEFRKISIVDFDVSGGLPNIKEKVVAELARSGRTDFETLHSTKTGEIRNVHVFVQEIQVGSRIYHYNIHRDITELRRSQQDSELKAMLLDATNESIFLHTLGGSIRFANEAAWRTRGFDRDELTGMNIIELNCGDDEELFRRVLQNLSKNQSQRFEGRHKLKNGATMPVEINSRLVDVGGSSLVLSTVRDISVLKAKEAEVSAKNRELLVLYKITRASMESMELTQMLQLGLDQAVESLGVMGGGIYLVDETGKLRIKVTNGLPGHFVEAVATINMGEGLSGKVAQTKKELFMDVSEYTHPVIAPLVRELGVRKLACGPLMFSGSAIGTIFLLVSTERDFTREEMDLILAIGQIIGIFAQNAKLYETARHEIAVRAESEKRLNEITSSLGEGLYVVDLAGKALYVNSRAETILGWSADEILGRNAHDLFHESSHELKHIPAPQCPIILAVSRGERYESMDEVFACKGRDSIPVNVVASPMTRDGRIIGGVVAFNDITDLKNAQTELVRHSLALERSNRELEQFAYVASHDLQEPLRKVASFAELLSSKYKGRLDEKADTYISFMVDGAKRMQTLINDLLTYSRVMTRGKEFELVDANEVLREVLEDLEYTITDEKANISSDPLPVILADRTQIRQLFQNLVGNAIKYHGSKSPEVCVGADYEPGVVRFFVKDNGIGIDPDYFERIFVLFQRLHSRGEYSGTGIGLAVCKRIVERHGGHIWVESMPGEGSTFYFTIPSANVKLN